MDPIWAKILTAYMILIGMISWCGNGVVIYIFATTKSLRTPANLLVINLAISDFGIMITNTPMMGINLYFETWVLGPMMCDIYAGLGSAFGVIITVLVLQQICSILSGEMTFSPMIPDH